MKVFIQMRLLFQLVCQLVHPLLDDLANQVLRVDRVTFFDTQVSNLAGVWSGDHHFLLRG